MTFQRPARKKDKKNKKSCEFCFLLVFAAQLFKMQITASIFQEREKLNWRLDKMAPGKTVHFFAQEETEKWQRKSFSSSVSSFVFAAAPFFSQGFTIIRSREIGFAIREKSRSKKS